MEAKRDSSARSRSFAAISCACCCSGEVSLHLPVALPAVALRAGLARNTGHGNAGRPIGRGGGPLRGRRRRERRISIAACGHCCLLLFLAFGLKLVLQVLHVVVGVVLKVGCGGWPFAAACCAGVFLPVELKSAATITSNAAPRYTKVLRFFCSTPFGSVPGCGATSVPTAAL